MKYGARRPETAPGAAFCAVSDYNGPPGRGRTGEFDRPAREEGGT